MTIATEITRIKTNIENAYSALEEKGATMPEAQNSDNLAETVSNLQVGSGEEEVIPEGYFKVVFVDYDGTVLSEQFVADGGNATPPDVPTHDNLTFTQWNRETTNIEEHQIIGASYSIPDGTVFYVVDLSEEQLNQNFYFTYKCVNSNATLEAYIDWGDGTTDILDTQLVNSVGWNSLEINHTYLTPGRYYIKSYYWQTLEGNTSFQTGGMLTKSTPILNSNSSLTFDYLRKDDCTIIPEKFEELKELYISPDGSFLIHDPFYAPNLENIVLSDKESHYLNGNTCSGNSSFFVDIKENTNNRLCSNNKIRHITLPSKNWLTTTVISYMPSLETVSYSAQGYYNIRISYCSHIKKIYNMRTDNIGNALNPRWKRSLTLSNLPNLQKLYNPIIEGTNASYTNLNSLKEMVFDYPVNTSKCYSLSKVTGQFDNVTDKALLALDECPSLQEFNINWSKIDLNNSSNIPKPNSKFLNGVLDLSSNSCVSIGGNITSSSTINPLDAIWCGCSYSKIILPPNLKSLNVRFNNMPSLKKIIFPDSLELIGTYSLFGGCYQLENVHLPKDVISTACNCYSMYTNCFALKNAIIPYGVIAKSSLISNCPSLEKIWISNGSDLSYYTSTSYTLCGTSQSSVMENVIVYTDATSKPDTWGEYWNYVGNSKYMNVVWGATFEEYEAA